VQFSAGAVYASGSLNPAFVEAGPWETPSATWSAGTRTNAHVGARMLPALAADDEPSAARRERLGALWCGAGATIDADAASGGTGRLVTLPTYPFSARRAMARATENAPPPDPAPRL
jgi:hypothetical protein